MQEVQLGREHDQEQHGQPERGGAPPCGEFRSHVISRPDLEGGAANHHDTRDEKRHDRQADERRTCRGHRGEGSPAGSAIDATD